MNREDPNLRVYNAPDVAAHYAGLQYLSPCERLLFARFLKPGMAILDLGVGGGRTTPYLSGLASHYVGADYAREMISACQTKFPDLEFKIIDAADLSAFDNDSFDSVVLAFNGIDYLTSDELRVRALREIHRVLKGDGTLIFSSHNPRAILFRPTWSRSRVRQIAARIGRGQRFAMTFVGAILTLLRAFGAFLGCLSRSVVRAIQRIPRRAFWVGEGYLIDSAHGGLVTHYAIPRVVTDEVSKTGFRLLQVLGDDHPLPSKLCITDWYYYAFAVDKVASPAHCE